jgi:hypothetical protein
LPARPREVSVEQEVLANIRNQRIAEHTVADLNLPDAFLRRVADRIIRESFQERHRVIVRSPGSAGVAAAGRETDIAAEGVARGATVVRASTTEEITRARAALAEGRPGLPGYRAALGAVEPASPFLAGELTENPETRRAAEIVGRRLATDGLLCTLAQAIEAIGAPRIERGGEGAAALLAGVGIPVDLVQFFASGDAGATIQEIASRLIAGASAASMRRELASRPLTFRQTVSGFRTFSESGEHDVGLVRIQVTGGEYWGGRGAGGSLDVLRRLLGVCPGARFVVSAEERHVAGILERASDWPPGAESRVTIAAEPLPVSQWAQDNGKPGEAGGSTVTLVPRYASRGEDGAAFVPGETFLADGLVAAGIRVAQSPLHFQGGNLLMVADPAAGHTLLIGEAEVSRNVALGLTTEQAVEALRIEFGAARAVVLPAVSFHIDYEVSVRIVGGRPIGFVNDTPGAVRIVLERGIEGLARSGAIAGADAMRAAECLRAGRMPEFMDVVGRTIAAVAAPPGLFPESLAAGFSDGPADLGAANLKVFLLAMDLAAAGLMMPAGLDRHTRSYYESFRRRDADRRVLVRRLESLGWRVAAVPSFADGAIGPNAVNGIHEARRFLMPAWGGFLSPLDAAAMGAWRNHLPESVEIVPVSCAESQRRLGGLHCSVSVCPHG